MNFNTFLGRILYAVLVGLAAFLVILVIGILLKDYNAEISDLFKKFSALIGILVGLVTYFTRPNPTV